MTDLAAIPNPFRDNVVQDAWQSPTDVSDIHADVFTACLSGIEAASRGVPDSVLIYGPAGSGKTHLLSRLQHHLLDTGKAAPDQVLRCVFVFVRLQTNPQLLWQHVRRRLASDLMRRDQGLSQLQRLLAHQIAERTRVPPRHAVLQLRVLGAEDTEVVAQHLRALGSTLDLPRDLCVVLEHLACNRHVRDASGWLAGDALPENVYEQLGLGVDLAEDREEAARSIVTALCRLAGETLPIVFCFDQVEALQRGLSDENALYRFGRMAADLHDADANVSLITCLQSALLEPFRRGVRQSDRDRMAKRQVVLDELTTEQVRKLVAARLATPDLRAARAAHPNHEFFPLSATLLESLAAERPCVPRRILAACAQAFEQLQRGEPARRAPTASFLVNEFEERRQAASQRLEPSDTTRIILQGVEAIAELEDATIIDEDPEQADLVLEGDRKLALSVRNELDGRSLTPRLKSLLGHVPRKDGARVAIVRDPRLPIPTKAAKAREYLEDLQKRGAVLVEPTVEALAALDALSAILADAKSGDLANDGEAVVESAVLAWIRGIRSELELEPVVELVDAMLGPAEPAPERALLDLTALLVRDRIVEVEAASRALSQSSANLVDIARRHPDRFLILDGPPTVLLDIAGVPSAAEVTS